MPPQLWILKKIGHPFRALWSKVNYSIIHVQKWHFLICWQEEVWHYLWYGIFAVISSSAEPRGKEPYWRLGTQLSHVPSRRVSIRPTVFGQKVFNKFTFYHWNDGPVCFISQIYFFQYYSPSNVVKLSRSISVVASHLKLLSQLYLDQ